MEFHTPLYTILLASLFLFTEARLAQETIDLATQNTQFGLDLYQKISDGEFFLWVGTNLGVRVGFSLSVIVSNLNLCDRLKNN